MTSKEAFRYMETAAEHGVSLRFGIKCAEQIQKLERERDSYRTSYLAALLWMVILSGLMLAVAR